MTKTLFGTDGIRGRVNEGEIRPASFVRLGESLGSILRKHGQATPKVLIGRDTRRSGVMIESAIVSGLLNVGVDVELGGIMPTPAVGFLTRTDGFDAGLMITASHNPPPDNGIKFFGRDGFKLSSDIQREIETHFSSSAELHVPVTQLGDLRRFIDAPEKYAQFAKTVFGIDLSLSGMTLCFDGANGAGSLIGPEILKALGADVIGLGISPNGQNINVDCGALHPKKLSESVLAHKADIGIALDGDADRLILVNEKGEIVDGDQIMGAIALDRKQKGLLNSETLVATIMSNLGLEARLAREGITLERAAVGDRYVVERMREGGFNVGGEQSGHIILSDYVTTGDAIISALLVLRILVDQKRSASEILSVFEPVPQVLKNVRYGDIDPLGISVIQEAILRSENRLGKEGRLVIRKSGTEPLIRIMAEAFDGELAETIVNDLVREVEAFVAKA